MTSPEHDVFSQFCHPERSESPAKRVMRAVEGPLRFLFALRDQVKHARRLTSAILKEIFDESAYSRFLARHQLTPSRDSYAAFWSEHERGKARRPRCC